MEANNTAIKHIKWTGRGFINARNYKFTYLVAQCCQNSGMNIHHGRTITTNRGEPAYLNTRGARLVTIPGPRVGDCTPARAPCTHALLDAADTLKPVLRAATYRTLIGLMAAAGFRTGEAIALDIASFDRHSRTHPITGK